MNDKPNEIYLIPGECGGEPCTVWCDDPAPSYGMNPDEAVKYVRADHIAEVSKMVPVQDLNDEIRGRLVSAVRQFRHNNDDSPGSTPRQGFVFAYDASEIHRILADQIAEASKMVSDPAEQFCDANCTWLDHHPDCTIPIGHLGFSPDGHTNKFRKGRFGNSIPVYAHPPEYERMKNDNQQITIKLKGAEAACRALHADKQELEGQVLALREALKSIDRIAGAETGELANQIGHIADQALNDTAQAGREAEERIRADERAQQAWRKFQLGLSPGDPANCLRNGGSDNADK